MEENWSMLLQEGFKLYQQRKFKESLPFWEQAVKEAEKTFGTNHSNYGISLSLLAKLYFDMNENIKAESLFKEAINKYEKVFGTHEPLYSNNLNNLALLYKLNGEYYKAEPLFIKCIEIIKQTIGEEHPNYIQSIENLAALYISKAEYSKAEPLYLLALDNRKKSVGENHHSYAIRLTNLARLYDSMGKYSKSEPLFIRSIEIFERTVGENHKDIALSLDNFSMLYYHMGEYSKAEALCKKALSIFKETVGENDHDYAICLDNLALLYRSMGEYTKAELLNIKALEIWENTYGENHPDFAICLNGLADTYRSIGNYSKAESFYIKALEIRKRVFGENHPTYAKSLTSLGGLYKEIGEYSKAESLCISAVEIEKKELGEEDLEYATSLITLGGLYSSLHEYSKAEPLFKKAIDINKKKLDKNPSAYATSLHELALLYQHMGEYTEAVQLYSEAIDIWKRTLGENHPHYATGISGLCKIFLLMGKYSMAEPYLVEVVEIYRRTLGENHTSYAISLNNLAQLFCLTGEYYKAEPLLNKSLEIRKNALGENHPVYATSLRNLAELEINLNKPEQALKRMLEVARIDNRMIIQMFSISDEKRMQDYIKTFQFNYYSLLSNFSQNYAMLKNYSAQILDVILKRKAINLEIVAIKRDSILAGNDPQLKVKFDELRSCRMAIGRLFLEDQQNKNPDRYREKLSHLEKEIESLEREISFQSPEADLEKKLTNAAYTTIRNLLPENSILIEFVWFWDIDFKVYRNSRAKYVAFILPKEENTIIEMIDLNDAEVIDQLISKFREDIINGRDIVKRDLGELPVKEKLPSAESNTVGSIYQTLLNPILNKSGETKKLLIAPDGNLSLLPIEVVPQPDGRYMVEDYEISYVDCGRDLIRFQYHKQPQSEALIIADPDFNLALSGNKVNVTDIAGNRSYELEEVFLEGTIRPGSRYYFNRLEGTKTEGENIKDLLRNRKVWMDNQVLDARFKEIKGPQILHIATHGFFMPKQEENEKDLLKGFRHLEGLGEKSAAVVKRYENPLLRSGLALAGVNTFIQQREPVKDAEDGLLTAYDVTGMDLNGTDLVVLSACETGLGEILAGEGVYGLRRSFFIAGARTLVVSLWKVPDEQTKELMVNFYGKMLAKKPKAQALREAQREMIDSLRKQHKTDHPYLWGAFICVGDEGMISEPGANEKV